MKKNYFTLQSYTVFACIFFACISALSAQVGKEFQQRYTTNIRGELVMLANNVVSKDDSSISANEDYTGGSNNNDVNVEYIDIDNDTSTFSSTSSDLSLQECAKIRYAGLYWSAIYPFDRGSDGNATSGTDILEYKTVKLAVPGAGYVDVPADEEIYYGAPTNKFWETSYVCYADVTDLITPLENPNGSYFVGNVRATQGRKNGGSGGGWVLLIVYEDPNMPGKYISTFDGYVAVTGTVSQEFSYRGFQTIPTGPVRARLGVGALEGDRRLSGDRMSIKADGKSNFTDLSNDGNPIDNFFNSNITVDGYNVTTRNTKSSNTLGFDADIFNLNNPSNNVIDNGETGVSIKVSTSGDGYGVFLNTISIDIIEPDVKLTKVAEDIDGNDITGAEVDLGQEMYYAIKFQNVGNDHAEDLVIRDALPANVNILESDIQLPASINGQSVTYTYDPATHSVYFNIPDNFVEIDDPEYEIRIKVQVVNNCYELRDACSNIIENLAYASYTGDVNKAVITDDPSVADYDACDIAIPGSTNFLADIGECIVDTKIPLCGATTELVAGNGFDTYQWYRQDASGNYVIIPGATNQSYSTSTFGTYKVVKTIPAPCSAFDEFFTVEPRTNNPANPFQDDADEVVTCTNDGSLLPKFFLCGTNDDRLLSADNFNGAISFEWQRLNDGCSEESIEDDCPTRSNSCGWTTMSTSQNYTLTGPGEYRLVVTYDGGCFTRYPFKAYENSVDPTITSENIICETLGSIDISGVSTDYEFAVALSSVNFDPNNATWQDIPSFEISNAGTYSVYIRQAGIELESGDRQPCLFKFENIAISNENFDVNTSITDPYCFGDTGSINVSVNNARAWYTYTLIDSNDDVVAEERQTDDNNHQFLDVTAGTYKLRVTTKDFCLAEEEVTLTAPPKLNLTAVVSQNVSCREGNILLNATGGKTPYNYAIWSYVDVNGTGGPLYSDVKDIPADAFQTRNIFDIYLGEQGSYEFIVVDRNNCYAISNKVTIDVDPDIEFTVNPTEETCLNSNDGSISINLSNANGYNVSYSIDGVTFGSSSQFNNLAPDTYTVTVRGVKGNITCDFSKDVTINPGVQISATASLSSDYSCLTDGEITFSNATGGSGTFEYSIDGVNWQDNPVFGGLTAGAYTPSYRDKNSISCVQEAGQIVIDPLTKPTDINFTTTTPQCPLQTSDVTLSVVGGAGAINYTIIAPTVAVTDNGNNNVFNGLKAGNTYTFRVTDSKGCTYDENLTIPLSTPIGVVGQRISNVSCVDGKDGEIRYTVSGFITNYNYTVVDASNTTVESSLVAQTTSTINITGLEAGTYTITVTDSETACTDTDTVIVEEPTSPLVIGTPDVTHESCSSSGTVLGAVTISASGGWGSYTYKLLDNTNTSIASNTSGSFTNLPSGSYTIQVEDANGCNTETSSFNIDAAIPPTLSISANDVCYNTTSGLTLTATVTSGGSGVLSYTLNGERTNTVGIFDKLQPGTHTITVTDGKNCTDTKSITINPELKVTASAQPISSCASATNVTITASGGDGNYVYSLVPSGDSPGTFSSTNPIVVGAAGTYDIYVRDKNGATAYCEAKYSVSITKEDSITISATNTEILCNGNGNASLTVTANNGKPPYRYSINGGTYQDSNVFNNLAPGAYVISVIDSNDCTESLTYILEEPDPLNASAGVSALVGCDSNGAEVRITNPQGGTPPYEYSFDGGSTYTSSAVGKLPAGDYTVFVRDSKGCIYGMDVTVDNPPSAPELPFVLTYNCDGTGNVVVNPSISTYDYTYSLGGSLNTPADSNVFTGLPVGTHTISVSYEDTTPTTYSDLLNENYGVGQTTTSPNISSVYCYEPQVSNVNIDCMPEASNNININDGEYAVTSKIVSPFGTWDSPVDHTTGASDGRFLAINVGSVAGQGGIIYQKTVQDVIPNQNIIVELYAYNLMRQGTSGQDPNIEVQLVDKSGNVINNYVSGNIAKHTSTSDWNKIEVAIDPKNNTELDIVIRTNNIATNGNDIAIDDIYAYQVPKQCPFTKEIQVTIEDGNAFGAEIIGQTNVSCNTNSDSELTISVVNFGASGYEYSLDDFATILGSSTNTTETISLGLGEGSYTLAVRDVANQSTTPPLACSAPLPFTITEPDPVVVTAQITSEITCNVTTATITATTAQGGTPGYNYQLEDELGNIITGYDFATNTTNRVFSNLPIGNYIVRAKDSNNCEAVSEAISVAAPETIAFTATPTSCYAGDNNATIEIEVTSGNGNYQISLNGGVYKDFNIDDTHHTISGLTPGSYEIDIKDGYGCNLTKTGIVITPKLNAIIVPKDIACNPGSIEVTTSGGDGSYQYAYMTSGSTPTVSDYVTSNTYTVNSGSAGSYDVYVKDGSDCTYMETVEIKEVTAISVTATATQPKCYNDNGAIDVTITGGVGPFKIVLNDGVTDVKTVDDFTGVTRSFVRLPAANYTITVTDNYGCPATATANLVNPEELTADIDPILPATCVSSVPDDYGFEFENYPNTIGTVQFSADGGVTWQSSPQFTGIGFQSGDIVYPSIRTVDGTGSTICQTDFPRYIIPYPLDDLNITISAIVVNCDELQVDVQGTQGNPPYEYTYSEDPSTFDPITATWTTPTPINHVFEDLVPGKTYVFYVRDDAGCVRQSSKNVNELVTLPMEITSTYEPACAGSNDAEITFTVTDTDGTVENSMTWELYDVDGNVIKTSVGIEPFASPQEIKVTGLAPNEYYIKVIQVDNGGTNSCIGASENILIEEQKPITGNPINARDITCDAPGLIEVLDITGGGGSYTFTLTSSNFDIDNDGIYDPAIDFITTTNNPMDVSIDDVLDPTVGSITVNVSVTDQFGCTNNLGSVALTISQPPVITNVVTDNCDGKSTITITATGGTGDYYYSIDNGLTFGQLNDNEFTKLPTGSYDIVVKDTNGCTVSGASQVNVYDPLIVKADLNENLDCQTGDQNAELIFEVSGGSSASALSNITYTITGPTGFSSSPTDVVMVSNPTIFTDANVPGTYTIAVTDAANGGCTVIKTVVVPDKITPKPVINSKTDVDCFNADNGSITVSAVDNGIGPFTFEIVELNGSSITSIQPDNTAPAYQATFSGLAGTVSGNTYTIKVTGNSDNTCSSTITETIYQPAQLENLMLIPTQFACTVGNALNEAVVKASGVTGGTGSYTYEFIYDNSTPSDPSDDRIQKGAEDTFNVSNIAGGNVVVNVYDENGCSISDDVDILPYNKLENIGTTPINPTCNGGDGSIQVDVTLSLGIGTDVLIYTLYDASGSQLNSFTGNVDSHTFTGLDVGNYQVKVVNDNTGCELNRTEELTDPNTFEIDLNVTSSVVCFGSQTGEITVELQDPTYSGSVIVYIYNTNGTPNDRSDDGTAIKSASGVGNSIITLDQFETGTYLAEVIQNDAPYCSQTTVFTITTPPVALTADTTVNAQTCALNDGVIEVINTTGGWGGYKYYVSTTPIPDENDVTNYSDNPRFEGLGTGTYEIWVIDQKGCPLQLPSETIAVPTPITGSITATTQNCDGLSGEITVDNVLGGSGGLYQFQLIKDGADFGTPQIGMTTTFTGLGAGIYEVRISDTWDCSTVLHTSITLYEEIALNYSIDNSISCDATNANVGGQVTIDATGGDGTYLFEVEYPDGTIANNGSNPVFTGLDQVGTYTFTVTDGVGCSKPIILDLDAPVVPELVISKTTNVSCEGASDGTIKASVTSTTAVNPPYTYVLTGPVTATNTSGLFTGLPAGNYTVTVNSALGCNDSEIVTITEPMALAFTASVTTEFACNPDNTIALGEITVNVDATTGTAPYLYSIDGTNYQNSNVFNVVDTGSTENYTLYVKDANGCFDTYPVVISPLPKITSTMVSLVTAITCANPEEVAVNVTGGSGDFTIDILPSGPSQSIIGQTANFNLPTSGDYVFQVTDNVTGCFYITDPYTVEPYNTIEATASASSSISCLGSNTGEITVDVKNYVGNYAYEVFESNGTSIGLIGSGVASTSTIVSGIPAGNYYVEITATDTPYCPTTTNTVSIKSPITALDINVTITEDLSCVSNIAEIEASANGGWGSYQFALVGQGKVPSNSDYASSSTFTNISAGTYDVYVKDAGGCEMFETITITQPSPIVANSTAISSSILCEGDKTGSITVSVISGGRPDFDSSVSYLYILNTLDEVGNVTSSATPQLSNVFTSLGAGNYSVTVTDNYGCDSDTNPVFITEPSEVVASLRILKNNTCTTGATLELSASGGTGNGYEYSTSENGPWTPMSGNSVQIQVPGPLTVAVTHQYFVRDAEECISQVSNTVTINPVRELEILPTVVTDVSCYNEATGYIKVDAQGGLGNYLYTLYDVSGSVVVRPEQTQNTFTDLPAGVYFVEVNSKDCSATERIQIEEGQELTSKEPVIFNPLCSDDLGRIELELQGGTGDYQFAISPNLDQFQSKNVFEDLEPGTYTIIAQDSKGCNPFVYKREIKAPSPVVAKANILEKEFCAGDKTGSFEINIAGGTAPYYTALNTQDEDKFVENRTMFEGLEGGETYVVFVKDANGCTTNVIVTLDKAVDLSPRVEMNQICFENSSVNEVVIELAQTDLEEVIYKLDDGPDQFENTFTNLTPGDHKVTVSYYGCEKTVEFTVDPIDPLNMSVGESNINQFTISPSGGAAPYQYFVNGVSTGGNQEYIIKESGDYEVKVIDANGCEVVAQISMTFIDIEIPNVFTPDGDANNDTWSPNNTLLYPNMVTQVFDRYGRVVAELRFGDEWDGKYNGAELPTGDYWYVIKLNDSTDDREFVGHFTLYR